MRQAKSFNISKHAVWRAYERVKANKGTAGVDSQSMEAFEENLKDNLYKIWNRMSSGTYFPPPVRTVMIPKSGGGERPLGIPTIADRIAQTVVKDELEPLVEPHFHHDSYGYRPGRSALDAIATTRKRCWRYAWVLDLDVRGFFDNLDHDLVLKAVRYFTTCRWVLLYLGRWLNAPAQLPDGTLISREKGTPQGGVISPCLANAFMHFAFDKWMDRTHPANPFERYADDIVAHARTYEEAEELKRSMKARLAECRLELHPEKTKIVYCKDDDRRDDYPTTKFDFLGYTFRPRRSKNRWGKYFINFTPAVSNKAAKSMRQRMRRWRLHCRPDKVIDDLARMFNPVINGWIQYYGKFYPSALYPVFRHLNVLLRWWVMRKYKRYRGHRRRAEYWLGRVARRDPNLFAHWKRMRLLPATG